MTRGFFICFEGGEGSGKSSRSRELGEALRARGIAAVNTREPGGTPGAEEIRNLLVTGAVDRWTPETEMLLFAAARREHVEKLIWPTLASGRPVICDRFVDSTLAYQANGDADKARIVLDLHDTFCRGLRPDVTFLLDLDPAIGLARSGRRIAAEASAESRYEAMELTFHQQLRRTYLARAAVEPERYVVIDATRTPEAIAATIWASVAARFDVSPMASDPDPSKS